MLITGTVEISCIYTIHSSLIKLFEIVALPTGLDHEACFIKFLGTFHILAIDIENLSKHSTSACADYASIILGIIGMKKYQA